MHHTLFDFSMMCSMFNTNASSFTIICNLYYEIKSLFSVILL